jgi:uncharacterized membrane protein
MRTPAQIGGHPIHPMLVTIPIGLWVFSLVCDLIARGSAHPETWSTASLYAMVGGVIGALCAAVFGLVDLMSLRERPVFKTALTHMALNLVIVVLYIVNSWMRGHAAISANTALGLSIVSIVLLLISGWLGGKMVYVSGVAVHAEDGAAETEPEARRTSTSTTPPSGRGGMGMPRASDRAMASDRPPRETDRGS